MSRIDFWYARERESCRAAIFTDSGVQIKNKSFSKAATAIYNAIYETSRNRPYENIPFRFLSDLPSEFSPRVKATGFHSIYGNTGLGSLPNNLRSKKCLMEEE